MQPHHSKFTSFLSKNWQSIICFRVIYFTQQICSKMCKQLACNAAILFIIVADFPLFCYHNSLGVYFRCMSSCLYMRWLFSPIQSIFQWIFFLRFISVRSIIVYSRRVDMFDFNCLCYVLLQSQMKGTFESHLICRSAFRQKGAKQDHLQDLCRDICKRENSTLLLGNCFFNTKFATLCNFPSFGKKVCLSFNKLDMLIELHLLS